MAIPFTELYEVIGHIDQIVIGNRGAINFAFKQSMKEQASFGRVSPA
jgi:hypothetical protein